MERVNISHAVAKGKVTHIWKEQKRDSYLGQETKLYVEVDMLGDTKIVIEDQSYCIPKVFTIECYKETSEAINHKAFGNMAIFNSDLEDLMDRMEGKIIDVMFTIINAKMIALLTYRINGQPAFFGEIRYAVKAHSVSGQFS